MELKDLVFELTAADGPAGFENGIAAVVSKHLQAFTNDIETDALGSVIARIHAAESGRKKLLLDAHMDEVGLIITGQTEGFLKFSALGGLDPRVLLTREVCLLTEPPIYGVIATMPPHVLSSDDMDKPTPIDDLFIDAGLTEDEARAVKPGTAAVLVSPPISLCGSRISGKAMDNRLGLAAILRALELLRGKNIPLEITVLASVQEEVGTRGAKTAVWRENPDYALVIDVTHAATADNKDDSLMTLGGGVAIDFGPGMNRPISNLLKKLAEDKNIPHMIEVEAGNTGTNSWPIQIIREGVVTGLLSIPLRYMHSPVETADLQDVEAAAKLIAAFAEALGKGELS